MPSTSWILRSIHFFLSIHPSANRKRRAKHEKLRMLWTVFLHRHCPRDAWNHRESLSSFPLSVLNSLLHSPTNWKASQVLPTSVKFKWNMSHGGHQTPVLSLIHPIPFGRGDVSISGLTLAFESPCHSPPTDLRPKHGTMACQPEQSMLHNSTLLSNLSH